MSLSFTDFLTSFILFAFYALAFFMLILGTLIIWGFVV
jgi:hypothetical protein